MKTFVILLISLFYSITATCQIDTLTSQQKDSLISWIARINTDLKDYDLIKQKSTFQAEKIHGLEAINKSQQAINVRQQVKLDAFGTSIIQLQSQNFTLSTSLNKAEKKAFWSGLENWAWRAGAAFLLYKTFISQ